VLEVSGVAIRESTPICEWLQETRPDPPLWPADPALRAYARGLLRWVDDELTINFFASFRKAAFGPDDGDSADIVERLRARLMRRWPVLDELLGRTEGPWLAGDERPTLADLAAMPLAVRIPQWKPELAPPTGLVRATAWLQALREHPHVAEVKRRGRPAAEL
jgi:glutathione S-transferase